MLILPVVTLVVLSAAGSAFCSVIPTTSPTLYRTVIGSYVLWGMGFPLANVIIILCFLRLIIHKVDFISSYIDIVALESGHFHCIITYWSTGTRCFRHYDTGRRDRESIYLLDDDLTKAQLMSAENAGNWESITLFTGLIIWGWTVVWVTLAAIGVSVRLVRTRIPFDLSWWALIFPLGI